MEPNHLHLESRLRVLSRRSGRNRYRDLLIASRGVTRVLTDDASGVTSNGGTISTTEHQVDMTAATVMIGGTIKALGALNDESLLSHDRACRLDGSEPEAIGGNGLQRVVAAVAVIVEGEPAIAFVHGDDAPIGDAAQPSPAQCERALGLAKELGRAGFEDYLPSGLGIVLAYVTVKRRQQVTLTFSGTPESGDEMTVVIDGEDVTHVADSTSLNNEVGDLRTAIENALGADYVIGGTNAVITIEAADTLLTEMEVSATIELTGTGSLDVAQTDTDQVTLAHSDPASDLVLKGHRLGGSLS